MTTTSPRSSPGAVAAHADTPPTIDQHAELYCPQCGYDLRALSGEICPECGLRVDRAALCTSQIPWAHRARIGRIRAYLRTVWIVTVRSNQLPQELSRPVSYRDAQRFRWITVSVASLPLAGLLLALLLGFGGMPMLAALPQALAGGPMGMGAPTPRMLDALLPWAAGALLAPVVPLGLVLFFILISGVPSYWFHPRSISVVRQNRAVALSYYAIAPLAWLPLPVLIFAAAGAWQIMVEQAQGRPIGKTEFQFVAILMILSMIAVVGLILMIWFSLVRLAKRAAHDDVPRTILAAVCIPVAWVLCGVVALYVFPWVVGFFYLVFDGFR